MHIHIPNRLKPYSKRMLALEIVSATLVLLLLVGGILWQVRPLLLQQLLCPSCGGSNSPTIYVTRHTDISQEGLNPPPIQTFLYAINGRTGKVQQTTNLQQTSAIYYQKIINGINYELFGNQGNSILLATALRNGAMLWKDTLNQLFTSVVASSTALYLYGAYSSTSSEPFILSIDIKNGSQLWEHAVGSISDVLLDDTTLIVQESPYEPYKGTIVALRVDNGQEIWKRINATDDDIASLIIENGHVFLGYSSYTSLTPLSLLELDEHTGALLWQSKVGVDGTSASFSVKDSCILIDTGGKKLTVLRETDKSVLWSYTLQSSYNPAQYNQWVYIDDVAYGLSAQIDPQTFVIKRIMTAWQIDTGKELFQTDIDISGDFNIYRLNDQLFFTSTNDTTMNMNQPNKNIQPLTNDIEARQAQTGALLWHKHLGPLPLYNQGSEWELSVVETSDAHSDDCSTIGCPYTPDLRDGADPDYYHPATDLHSNDGGYTTFYIPDNGEQNQSALYLTLYQKASQSYMLYAINPRTGALLWQIMLDTLSVPTLPTLTEFPLPTVANTPNSITTGPDGNLWFTELPPPISTQEDALQIGKIGRITPAGKITEFALPLPDTQPEEITAGPDGNLWFTEDLGDQAGKIGRITPAGKITEFTLPPLEGGNGIDKSSRPLGITAGRDGNLWFTEVFGNKIGRITPAGKITEFALPLPGTQPGAITAGPDGNLWFVVSGLTASPDSIGRITPAGKITLFPLPISNSDPYAITTGPDGNLWFIELATGKIGRITPLGVINEFLLPSSGSLSLNIISGPDGDLWFTSSPKNQIGRITPIGQITEFALPTFGSLPDAITLGPDGNLWFGDQAGKIGRIIIGK